MMIMEVMVDGVLFGRGRGWCVRWEREREQVAVTAVTPGSSRDTGKNKTPEKKQAQRNPAKQKAEQKAPKQSIMATTTSHWGTAPPMTMRLGHEPLLLLQIYF